MARVGAALLLCLTLTACGSGSGGGGETTPPPSGGGPPPPPPPPPSPPPPPLPPVVQPGTTFPTLIEFSAPENNRDGLASTIIVSKFAFYAPGDEMPSNLVLTGPDATYFTVQIVPSDPPGADGMREITVYLRYTAVLNYENPQDADKNNIYDFTAGATYKGKALSANFKVGVLDEPDAAEAGAKYVYGVATGQEFGQVLAAIPDITGDGKSELGISIQTGIGPATGYILPGDYLKGLTQLTTDITTLGDGGTRFPDKNISGAKELNRVSASETRGGVSVLVSDAGDNKFYLFQAMTPDEYQRGDLDPAMSPNRITYENSADAPMEGRMIGDANADGVADIFIQTTKRQEQRGFGLIFGRSPSSPADRTRTTEPDIGFTYTFPGDPAAHAVEPKQNTLEAKLVSDVDGDGYKDLIVMLPDYGYYKPYLDRGAMWLIRSWVLRTPGKQTINLDAMGPALGFRINGRTIASVIDTTDFDGDGFRTLLFQADGSQIYAIDGNDFNDIEPATLPAAPATGEPPPALGPKSVKLQGFVSSGLSVAGDLDGDGLEDLIGADTNGLSVIGSAYLKKQMADFSYAPVTADRFGVKLNVPLIYFGNAAPAPPLALPDSDLIAVPTNPQDASGSFNPEFAGRTILIKLSDIRAAMAKAAVTNSGLSVFLR